MKQAIMTAPGEIESRRIDEPAPAAHEIIMATKRIGVCGSDIHVFHGKHPYTSYPAVQGHEVSGIVAAVGSVVSSIKEGDRITFMPQIVYGEYYLC